MQGKLARTEACHYGDEKDQPRMEYIQRCKKARGGAPSGGAGHDDHDGGGSVVDSDGGVLLDARRVQHSNNSGPAGPHSIRSWHISPFGRGSGGRYIPDSSRLPEVVEEVVEESQWFLPDGETRPCLDIVVHNLLALDLHGPIATLAAPLALFPYRPFDLP